MNGELDNQWPTQEQPALQGDIMSREMTTSASPERRRGRLWKRLRLIALAALAAAALLVGAVAALVLYVPLPPAAFPQSTQILDSGGNVLASLQGGVNRRTVALRDISPWLVKATLAAEDRRFYEHAGLDVRGLLRAAWVDVRHLSKEQGASTLTQQLARNLYLSHERTWKRKAMEAWYAAKLEQNYSKDEILEMYLNQIYYGHGVYGAEAAARLYFGKPAKELTLAESAMLAGIPKGPRYYSPHLHREQAEARQSTVLQAMADTRFISRRQAAEAAREKLDVKPLPKDKGQVAPYFVDYVRKLAAERIQLDERLLNEGGLQIVTTLDGRMQKAAEEAVASQMPKDGELQAALVAIDPRSGQIKAMVGGRDYGKNQFNRVFATTRQPGSSFKPFVYAAALDARTLTPATRFRSAPTVFYYDDNRHVYRPSNFNGRYFNGDIGLRQAIKSSDNIYAVNTIMQVGPEEVISMARKLGITSKLDAVPSLALGTFPVSPFEMASAYSAFAAGGARTEPVAIQRILDRDGRVLYEARPRKEQVLSPALSYVLSDLMQSVFDSGGTAHRVSRMLKRPVAGKSGTTTSDAWFVGYTPDLVASVWVGYDRGRAITSGEAHRAAPIFAQFAENALASEPAHAFPVPEGVVRVYIDPATGQLASENCPGKVLESFLAGTEPTQTCYLHGEARASEETGRGPASWWRKVRHWWKL
ncbi:PBP1A family penicillin-binding protein [Cohnella xylanilytica]|uniref:PBP1A family penicillin-binding protein n=2 Tax=Cohnella xylanilytica TaxID=557555 RepID=A0A841TXR4_9BACL|nr:PBP1A family penicillin-binding protein [Cohnella xylanilytica]MBB6691822.1 PBP1A family penicillin-binding protein [Cohnella xylanilytica]